MYASLGCTLPKDSAAAQAVPYVVLDASDTISMCVRALAKFSGSTAAVTSICRCLFASTHSLHNARCAIMCGAMLPLKSIVRDGSQGTGTVAAAAAALSHVVGKSGANVDAEPMWQDVSLLEKLLFVTAGAVHETFRHVLHSNRNIHVIPCAGSVVTSAVDEVAWCSMLLSIIIRSSWVRTRLFVNPAALKDAIAVLCDNSMNKFSKCIVSAVATISVLGNLFEGSREVQWAQCLVRSGVHRAAQAHTIA